MKIPYNMASWFHAQFNDVTAPPHIAVKPLKSA